MNDRFNIRYFNKNSKKFEYLKIGAVNFNLFTDWTVYEQGQFCTGLNDKNGKLIYEKDIIRFYFDKDEIIAVIEWDNDECRFYLNTTDFFKDKYVTDYEIVKQEEYEIIGNIYENKELLESEG